MARTYLPVYNNAHANEAIVANTRWVNHRATAAAARRELLQLSGSAPWQAPLPTRTYGQD